MLLYKKLTFSLLSCALALSVCTTSAMYLEQKDKNGRPLYYKNNGTSQRRIAGVIGQRAIKIQNIINQQVMLDTTQPVLPIVDAILHQEKTTQKRLTYRQIVVFARKFNSQASSSSSSSPTPANVASTTTSSPTPHNKRKKPAKRQRPTTLTSSTAQTTTLATQKSTKNAPAKKQKLVAPFIGLANNANYCFANAALQGIACVQNTLHSPHCTCNINMHNQLWNATQQISQQGDNAYDARNFINNTAQQLQLPAQYDDSAQFIRRFFQLCAQNNCICTSNILFSTIIKADYDQGDDATRDMINQQLCGSISTMLLTTQHQISQLIQNDNQIRQHLIESHYAPVLMMECPGRQKIQPREQLQFNFVNNQQKTYTLRSILLYNGGHYTALVKGQGWFLCSDETISNGQAIFNALHNRGKSGYFYPRMLIYESIDPTPTQAHIAQWTLAELPPIVRNNNNFAQQLNQTINDYQRETLIMNYVQQVIINSIQNQIPQNRHLVFGDYLLDQGQIRTFLNADVAGRAAIITVFNADLAAKIAMVTNIIQTMQNQLPQNQHQVFIDYLTTHRGAIGTFINAGPVRRAALINSFLNTQGQWACSIL